MHVPSDSFGGQSPERKAAGILRTFFTFVSARVVLAQLEGSGRGSLGAYDSRAAADLTEALQDVPMRDGDEWLAALMKRNTSLGLRLMEVREAYCSEAFEWDHLQRIAQQDMKGANTKLMRQFAAASLAASLSPPAAAAAVEEVADNEAAAKTQAAPTGDNASDNDARSNSSASGSSGAAGASAASQRSVSTPFPPPASVTAATAFSSGAAPAAPAVRMESTEDASATAQLRPHGPCPETATSNGSGDSSCDSAQQAAGAGPHPQSRILGGNCTAGAAASGVTPGPDMPLGPASGTAVPAPCYGAPAGDPGTHGTPGSPAPPGMPPGMA